MPLSATKIKELLKDNSGSVQNRLVITPILDLEQQAKPGTSSIDVRLGQRFKVPLRSKLDRLDHLSPQHRQNIQRYTEDHYVFIGDYFVLHPRQFVLGETLEWVHLPPFLAAYVIGRSSWGRDGLIIATAVGVHPNFSGVLTLELTNLGEIPIRLYPGLTIAQLFIHNVDKQPTRNAIKSSFAGSTGPRSGNPAEDEQHLIRYFARMRGFEER